MDLEPVQQAGEDAVRPEGGPHGEEGGKQKAQSQQVADLPLAGRGGEPVEDGMDQVQPNEGVEDPQVKVGVPPYRRQQQVRQPGQGEAAALSRQEGRDDGIDHPPEDQQAEGGQDQPGEGGGHLGLALLQGRHAPKHKQGGNSPQGQPLIDGQHLPSARARRCQLLPLPGQQEHDGAQHRKNPEKTGPTHVTISLGHQGFSGTISIQ